MNILLLGATGRTGKLVLEELLKSGYGVHALVRNGRKVSTQSEQLTVLEGDTRDPDTLVKAISGCEGLISVLNVSRTSDFPWAKLRAPERLLSDTMKNILNIASPERLKKIVVCSAWGVHETRKELPGFFRWLIDHSNIGFAYRDHERQETLLRNSHFDYTIVRPVGLTNFSRSRRIRVTVSNRPKPKMTISRRSVARFLVKSLSDPALKKSIVTISEG